MSSTIPLIPCRARTIDCLPVKAVMFGGMMSYQQLIGNHHCTCDEWYHYHHWPLRPPLLPTWVSQVYPQGPISRRMLPPGEYGRRYRQEPSDVTFCQITLTSVIYIADFSACYYWDTVAVFLQTNMLLVKANGSKSCHRPLVATKSEISWYPYVDGCGLQCENVLFTETDHERAHVFIAVTGSVCFICTLFAVVLCCFFQILNNMVLRTLFCSISIVLHTLCRKSKAFDFSS